MKASAEPITTDTWLTRGYVYTPLSRADDVLAKVQEYDESADFSLSAPHIPKGYIAIKVVALDAKTRNDLRSRVYHPCNLRKSRFSVSRLMWSDYMAYPIMDVNVYPSDNDIPDAVAAEIINEQLEAAAVAEQDAEHELTVIAKIRLMVLEANADAVADQLTLDIWQTKQEIIAMMTPVRQRYALRQIRQALNDKTNVPLGGSRYSSFSRQLENFNQTWNRSGETRRIA